MARRPPLFQAIDPAQLSSGLLPDRHALQRPLWERASNVRFYGGKVKRLIPAALAFAAGSAGQPSRGISQHQDSNGTRWTWLAALNVAGDLELYRWYGPAAELVYTFGAANVERDQNALVKATFADLTHYGDWTILNTGQELPMLYKPGVLLGIYPQAPQAQLFMKKLSFVVALGTGLARKGIAWSDGNNIELWTIAEDNSAGDQSLEELDTGIVAGANLGQFIAVYAEDQMALVQFIGAPFWFSARVMLDGIGAVGKQAVASDGRANYGVGRNGVWRTDGQSFQYIDRNAIQDYLQDNVNWSQASKITAARNDVTGCFEFSFPMGDSLEVSEAWAFDPTTGGWGQVEPWQTQMERRLLDQPLGAGGNTVKLLNSDVDAVAPLDLATKPLLLQSPHMDFLIDEADILVNAASGVEFRVGVSNFLNSESFVDWSSWQVVRADMRTYRLDLRVSGIYYKVEFRSTADDWLLDLQGFLLYGTAQGSRRDKN